VNKNKKLNALITTESNNNYYMSRAIPQVSLIHPILEFLAELKHQGRRYGVRHGFSGWLAAEGRYAEARRLYFQAVNHDRELWSPVSPNDIEAALDAGEIDWVTNIAADIGWPTAEAAAIFAGLAIALEKPIPKENTLRAADKIMEGYNSARVYCYQMIVRKMSVAANPLERILNYWLCALEHSSKRDSGETWAVISSALVFFDEQFGHGFTGSLWRQMAKAHKLLSSEPPCKDFNLV